MSRAVLLGQDPPLMGEVYRDSDKDLWYFDIWDPSGKTVATSAALFDSRQAAETAMRKKSHSLKIQAGVSDLLGELA